METPSPNGDLGVPIGLVNESGSCDTRSMNEIRPQLTLIEGGFSGYEAEIAHLLEDIPAELAMEQLRLLRRRIQPAANSSLEVISPVTQARPGSALD